jgi:hypothetical protein
MTASTHPLDPLLPLLEPDAPAVLVNAEVLEVQEMAQLMELSRDPKIGRYLLARLSDTVALIDPGSADELVKALRAAGHTPRTTKGMEP